MAITTTSEKFMHELGDIYDAEHRFLKGQEEMLELASDPQLQGMIQQHIAQSKGQVQILEQVFKLLGQQARGQTCDAAVGLVSEAQKVLKDADAAAIRDCLIGGAAAKVEHYEIASYRGLIIGAQAMDRQDVLNLLQQNLQQEERTAQLLEQSAPHLLQKARSAEGLQTDQMAQGQTVPQSTVTRTM